MGLAGSLLLGALGLRRAYSISLSAYRGEERGRTKKPAVPAAEIRKTGPRRRLFVERRLPGLPEPASGVALATLASMWRAPEVKMALGVSVFVPLFIGGSIFFRASPTALPEAARPFVVSAMAMVGIFMSTQFVSNVFGYDRNGFRGMLLTPVDRRWLVLGKNVAFLPVGLLTGGVIVVAAAIWLKLSVFAVLAAVLRLLSMLVIATMLGNLFSILLPYRIQSGSLRPSKPPTLVMVAMIFAQFLFPLALAPVFVPPLLQLGWDYLGLPRFVPIDFGLSLLLAGGILAVYGFLLGPTARLFQRREMRILQAVTTEME